MADTAVEWQRLPSAEVPEPLVWEGPYLELKLEHPSLDPQLLGESFVPDAVPYQRGDDHRVFCWRPAVDGDEPAGARGVCATTEGLFWHTGATATPALLAADGTELVVDGTVAGDARRVAVEDYDPPAVELHDLTPSRASLSLDDQRHTFAPGARTRLRAKERTVTPDGGEPTTVVPELAVRFPGDRRLHHPGGESRLFPDFDLSLADLSRPLSVPLAAGELDHETLASDLGVDLAARPYPERMLWQALCHTAFDPHAETVARLGRAETGHLVCVGGRA